jgi:hypothetical protein
MKNPEYIEISAEVRYWEDASINGVEDSDGTSIPCRKGDLWTPVVRLDDGLILDWPEGKKADIHFKVCDAGEYWLLDAEKTRIAKWAGFYVPDDDLCPGKSSHGDYIIMCVGSDGKIDGWRRPTPEFTDTRERDDEDGNFWRSLT